MIKITYEYNGEKLDSPEEFTESIIRDLLSQYGKQAEEEATTDLLTLQSEMDKEGGQLTITLRVFSKVCQVLIC